MLLDSERHKTKVLGVCVCVCTFQPGSPLSLAPGWVDWSTSPSSSWGLGKPESVPICLTPSLASIASLASNDPSRRRDQSGTAMTDCREFRPIGVVPGKSIDWHLFQSHGVYEDGFQIENVSSIRFLSSFWQVPDWKPGAALLLVMGHTDIPQLGVLLGFCGWEILGSSKPCLRFLPNLGRL